MDYKKAYKQIRILEIEVRSFADEGYKVRYDFERNLISWRDYYMWNNNFMKSMTDAKRRIIEEKLPGSRLIECVDAFMKGTVDEKDVLDRPAKWEITIEFNDKTKMKHSEEERFPAEWIEWRTMIEATTECTFRLH
jgi:hypothetical protein